MKKMITLLMIYLVSSSVIFGDGFDEIKERHEQFFSSLNSSELNNYEHINMNIEQHLDDIVREIKRLPNNHLKKIQLESLIATLGHGKKRKKLIFKSRDAQIASRPPFLDVPLNHGTFRKTIKHVISLWVTTPDALDKDVLERLHNLFEIPSPLVYDNDALEKNVLLFYPDHPSSVLRYHPWPVILDPEKIHSLQLMSIEGGNSMSNAFGHSALRIVMCAPQRNEITDACLHDVAFHIVLSFRAEIDKKEIITPLKGVAGSYPSRAFLMPLNDMLEQYLEREGRTIITIPLELERTHIDLFVAQLIRASRQERPYEFFSNNCATEIWSFLQTIILHPKMFSDSPLRPNSVIKSLQKTGVIKKDPSLGRKKTANELWQREQQGLAFMPHDAKQKFFFKSLRRIFKRNHMTLPLGLFELESQNPRARLALYSDLLENLSRSTLFEDIDRQIYVAMVLMIHLEQEIERKLQKLLNSEATQEKSSPEFNHSEDQISEMSVAILNWVKDNGNQLIINSKSELKRCTAIQAEIRDKFSENWRLKRQLDLFSNKLLSEQEEIFIFLKNRLSLSGHLERFN